MPDADEAVLLYLRQAAACRLGVPATDPRCVALALAIDALWPALDAAAQPGVYGRLSVEVVAGHLQEPRMDWRLRQTFPRRAG